MAAAAASMLAAAGRAVVCRAGGRLGGVRSGRVPELHARPLSAAVLDRIVPRRVVCRPWHPRACAWIVHHQIQPPPMHHKFPRRGAGGGGGGVVHGVVCSVVWGCTLVCCKSYHRESVYQSFAGLVCKDVGLLWEWVCAAVRDTIPNPPSYQKASLPLPSSNLFECCLGHLNP